MSRSDHAAANEAAQAGPDQKAAVPDASPLGVEAIATDDLPWDDYHKAQVPHGWAHPFGRDRIARALREARATVGSLSLGRPDLPPRPGPQVVFDLFWLGDARAGYFGPIKPGRSRLLMRWTAVPAEHRMQIARQLEHAVLEQGCRWAAASLSRGNAWSASEHRFLVSHVGGRLQLSET